MKVYSYSCFEWERRTEDRYKVSLRDILKKDANMKRLGYDTIIHIDTDYFGRLLFLGKLGAELPESVKGLIRELYNDNSDAVEESYTLYMQPEDLVREDFMGDLFNYISTFGISKTTSWRGLTTFIASVLNEKQSSLNDKKRTILRLFVQGCIRWYITYIHKSNDGEGEFCTGGVHFSCPEGSEEVSITSYNTTPFPFSYNKETLFNSPECAELAKAISDFTSYVPLSVGELVLRCDLIPVIFDVEKINDFYIGVSRMFENLWDVGVSETPLSQNEYAFACGMYMSYGFNERSIDDYLKKYLNYTVIRNFVIKKLRSLQVFSDKELSTLQIYFTKKTIFTAVRSCVLLSLKDLK